MILQARMESMTSDGNYWASSWSGSDYMSMYSLPGLAMYVGWFAQSWKGVIE